MSTLINAAVVLVFGAVGGSIVWWVMNRQRSGGDVMDSADVVADSVRRMVIEHFGDRLDKLKSVEELTAQKLSLENDVATLRRQKIDIETDFGRRERDLEHAAGLLRKELDAELKRAVAEAEHGAQTKILAKEREFNEQRMEFAEARFKGELEGLRDLVETLTERLPDVSARLKLDGKV